MVATQTTVGWLDGVVISTQTRMIHFDPHKKKSSMGHNIFISHAHNDHVRGLSLLGKGYLTAETKEILEKRKQRDFFKNCISVRFGNKVVIDKLEITVHNSGHVLGSAQYEISDSISTIVYTGDINCREMLTTKAAEVIPCDTLILETTYGNPSYSFPNTTEIYVKIINWTINEMQKGNIPTFIVYSVGKAQEIVKIFNEFTNLPIVTSHSVAMVNEVYNRYGVKLNYFDAISEEGKELLKQPRIQVISPSEKRSASGRCSFAYATGWAVKYGLNSTDVVFPLSSHADFNQLVNYVRQAKPKEIFTVHGFKEDFARYVSKKFGIRAREIQPIKDSLHNFLW